MSVAKTLKHSLSDPQIRLSLVLLALLSGCSSNTIQTMPTNQEDASHPQPVEINIERQDPEEKEVSPQEPLNDNPQSLCVYETIKGIAEITEITGDTVTFKFYPGDRYFNISQSKIPYANIKLEQELKAIARSPISGPCKSDEFELLTTIE